MNRTRYRCLVASRVETTPRGVTLLAEVAQAPEIPALRLTVQDYQLAQLFDGARDASARLQAAQAQGLPTSLLALESLAADLTEHGLLQSGTHESLPPPPHFDDEFAAMGWVAGQAPAALMAHGNALPPSSLPGSRITPGLTGGLTGLVMARRGQPNALAHPLDPALFAGLGRWLIWPLKSRAHLLGFVALLIATFVLVYNHRYEWLRMSVGLFGSYQMLLTALLGAALVNVLSMSARAAAVARYTPEKPRIGVVFSSFLSVPHLFVDTAGAAERGDRATRLRIVASGLLGSAVAAMLAALTWFWLFKTHPALAKLCVGLNIVTLISLIMRLNPLTRYDGYFLLSQLLDTPDLREQAMGALSIFRQEVMNGLRPSKYRSGRPWFIRARVMPYKGLVFYGFLVVAFIGFLLWLLLWQVGGWVADHFRGTGFLILVSAMGAFMATQYSRSTVERNPLGHVKKPWRPSRMYFIVAAIVIGVGLIPYPYDASGSFQILPRNRADVSALVAGDVREVLVKEGDTVEAGQVLARLDDAAQRARVASSRAELARLASETAIVRQGARAEEIEVARSRVQTARATLQTAEQSARRLAAAYKGKSVSSQEYERAQGAAEIARQQLTEAQQQLALVASPAQQERLDSLDAERERIEAELGFAEEELANTQIKAPIHGRVVSAELQFARGRYLARGDLIATIEDREQVLADIRIPEAVIGDVQLDAAAKLKPWAFPYSSFKGQVVHIAPAADDDTYGKVIRVQVVINDPEDKLRSGMTGNAKVDAGWSLTGIVFTRAIMRFVLVELWSWIP